MFYTPLLRNHICSYNGNTKLSHGFARLYGMQVIITTYELILKDAAILNQIKWNYMMVDEAHRLKNHESALYQEMTQFHFKNRLLITGECCFAAYVHIASPTSSQDFEVIFYSLQYSFLKV